MRMLATLVDWGKSPTLPPRLLVAGFALLACTCAAPTTKLPHQPSRHEMHAGQIAIESDAIRAKALGVIAETVTRRGQAPGAGFPGRTLARHCSTSIEDLIPSAGDNWPEIVTTRGACQGTRIRADWEAPAALLVAFEEDWLHELATLTLTAKLETDVVVLVTPDQAENPKVKAWLSSFGLSFITLDYDTPWIRDYGPVELIDATGQNRWADMIYSPEGRPLDDALPTLLAGAIGANVAPESLWMDGGGLISNGDGLCAMTESTFEELSAGEDPVLVLGLLERFGCHALAVTPALVGEETGHIDVVAQFVGPASIVVANISERTLRSEAAILDQTATIIEHAAQRLGRKLAVTRIPMPVIGEIYYSYINGVRLRRSFLAPTYEGVPRTLEGIAHRRLRQALPPGVRLLGISADEMIRRGGAIHCVTLGLGVSPLPALEGRSRLASLSAPRPAAEAPLRAAQ